MRAYITCRLGRGSWDSLHSRVSIDSEEQTLPSTTAQKCDRVDPTALSQIAGHVCVVRREEHGQVVCLWNVYINIVIALDEMRSSAVLSLPIFFIVKSQ